MKSNEWVIERLYKDRLIMPGGCWIWTGATAGGYGQVQIEKKQYYVHRLMASIIYKFDINDSSIHTLHTCDISLCFNPEHLFQGNPEINAKDYAAKGRRSGRRGYYHMRIANAAKNSQRV
jgi:hypothetical protein